MYNKVQAGHGAGWAGRRRAPGKASLLEGEKLAARRDGKSRLPDQCRAPRSGSLSLEGAKWAAWWVGVLWGVFFSKLRASGGGQVELGQGKGWLSLWTVRARLDPLPRF